jgi:DNA-binding PadR family transcriptional regulator
MRKWTNISRVAIYQVLARMTERGWVQAATEREGNMPQRTVYTMTPAGEEALRRLVAEGLASDGYVRFDYGVPLVYLDLLPPAVVIELLERRKTVARDMVERMESRRDFALQLFHRGADTPNPHHDPRLGPLANISHTLEFYRMEERWLDWLLDLLRAKTQGDAENGS